MNMYPGGAEITGAVGMDEEEVAWEVQGLIYASWGFLGSYFYRKVESRWLD